MSITPGSCGRSASGLVLAVAMWLALPATATMPDLTFSEIVAGADLVFYGTVVAKECRYGDDARIIVTDITFEIDEVIARGPAAAPLEGDTVLLTAAGGRIGDYMVRISDVPRFSTGERYVVFARYDGIEHANPVIGGYQGVFPVAIDDATGVAYPLSSDRRPLLEVDGGPLDYGPRSERISAGAPVKAAPLVPDLRFEDAPHPFGLSAEQGAHAVVGVVGSDSKRSEAKPITLHDFIATIRQLRPAGHGEVE